MELTRNSENGTVTLATGYCMASLPIVLTKQPFSRVQNVNDLMYVLMAEVHRLGFMSHDAVAVNGRPMKLLGGHITANGFLDITQDLLVIEVVKMSEASKVIMKIGHEPVGLNFFTVDPHDMDKQMPIAFDRLALALQDFIETWAIWNWG